MNAEPRAIEQMMISLLIYMNYEPKLKGKDRGGGGGVKSNNIKAFVS